MSLDLALTPFDERVAQVRRQVGMDWFQHQVFDRALSLIDRGKVEELQGFVATNADRLSQAPAFKYLDMPLHLAEKARLFVDLSLDRGDPCRILDLGAGPGHFLFLAKCYGHQGLGLDVDNEIYDEMFRFYGLDRITRTIVSGEPLDLPDGFDLITAMDVTFNRPVGRARRGRATTFWTFEEWRWFFDEIGGAMNYPGRIFFRLNPQFDPETGRPEADNLLEIFARNGAKCDRQASTALFELERPLSLRD